MAEISKENNPTMKVNFTLYKISIGKNIISEVALRIASGNLLVKNARIFSICEYIPNNVSTLILTKEKQR